MAKAKTAEYDALYPQEGDHTEDGGSVAASAVEGTVPTAETTVTEEADEFEAEDKAQAHEDYEHALDMVRICAEGTATEFHKRLWAKLGKMQDEARVALETEDKAREIVREQETIKVVNAIRAVVEEPVKVLNQIVDDYPLFTPTFEFKATFSEANGVVSLVLNPKFGKAPKKAKKGKK